VSGVSATRYRLHSYLVSDEQDSPGPKITEMKSWADLRGVLNTL